MSGGTLNDVVSAFGAATKAKLSSKTAVGQPEDQLRAPLEGLIAALAAICGLPAGAIVSVGESSLSDLKTRPDYAITRHKALIGFIEVKAPGKGADPRKFTDAHDRDQWEKLKSLPNLIYTDGNGFSLWRNGSLEGAIVRLDGDVETSGATLAAPSTLVSLINDFFQWEPIPPKDARQLADTCAHLCRFLRDEVTEQLERGTQSLTDLAKDWRRLLFPTATNAVFADGYAQAVTFGLLMARARGIPLDSGLDKVATELRKTNSLIGTALRLLTDDAANQDTLKTSLATLTRVLHAVDWTQISKGDPDAWLYFYENFLNAYDKVLRRKTGSYYTPPEVVTAMVRLVDEALRDSSRFGVPEGLASPKVTLADPAMGTGTFLLGVLRRIADTTAADLGPGAVPGVIQSALQRLIGFEMQFGPFAVAQLRLVAEVVDLTNDKAGAVDSGALRLFVTDTLGNPDEETEWIPAILGPLAQSRREANAIKREEPITVVLGNPPYKEKARGQGGWIESGSANVEAPLAAWMPPREWGVGAHAKHLRNLYVYFWRWATWKVFGGSKIGTNAATTPREGIVCYITVAGFLNGPGFEQMRADLRRDASEIWVIDCSPEGHQPAVSTRIFQGVQQPVCIVLASRSAHVDPDTPARVRFLALPSGRREEKFVALAKLSLESDGWLDCPADWRGSFLPAGRDAWSSYPALEELFLFSSSGVLPGRTWVIAPDAATLGARWKRLVAERDPHRKEVLFHPTLRRGTLADRHTNKLVADGLYGHEHRPITVANDQGLSITPCPYSFRSFDRQWIIPDNRLLLSARPKLWTSHSNNQVYLTALSRYSPTSGPAVTFTCLMPDMDYYNGRGGRVYSLWSDRRENQTNVNHALIETLVSTYEMSVTAPEFLAYIAAVTSHSAYIARFGADLVQPGLRIPLTAERALFVEAVTIGREVVWLHTFGERFVSAKDGRPSGPPRLPFEMAPRIPAEGAIPTDAGRMPNSISYNATERRLHVGDGFVDNVPPAVWAYEVSGMQVLVRWFSYRRRDRARPIIGDRRPPSPLGDIQPDHWLAEYTTELMNVLHVLGRIVALESKQADLLERICAGPLLTVAQLRVAGVIDSGDAKQKGGPVKDSRQGDLLD